MKVWKYALDANQDSIIEMPRMSMIIHCREQDNKPCIWVMFDDQTVKETRHFIPVVTGLEFDSDNYVGTCHLDNGQYVVHIYEKISG